MIANRVSIFKNLSFFLLALSIVCVPVLNGISSSISDYFLVKVFFLALATIFSFAYSKSIKVTDLDILVYVYFFYSIFSFYWSDLNISTFFTYLGLWLTYLLTFVVIRNLNTNFNPSFRLIFLTIFFEILILFTIYDSALAVNGGYVVGHVSIVLLLLKKDLTRLQTILTLPVYFSFSGLRFFVVVLLTLIKDHRIILLGGITSIIGAYILTNAYVDTEIYSLILGYRIAEPIYMFNSISNDTVSVFFGKGFGSDAENILMGTKGIISHYGVFHNFYFTLLFNNGLLGLTLFLSIFVFFYHSYPKSVFLPSIAILLLMIAIDSHRDGIWPLFFILAFAKNNEELISARRP